MYVYLSHTHTKYSPGILSVMDTEDMKRNESKVVIRDMQVSFTQII